MNLTDMKFRFEGDGDYSVYVVNLDPEIPKDKKNMKPKFLPPEEFLDNPIGSVYVGVTTQSREERLKDHLRGHKAGKGIVTKYCGKVVYQGGQMVTSPLWDDTDSFSGLEYEDALKLESWLGWKISEEGYYVWGPHYHKEKNFLGIPPFV